VREEDTVSRLGGDEFVVLLKHVASTQGAGRVAAQDHGRASRAHPARRARAARGHRASASASTRSTARLDAPHRQRRRGDVPREEIGPLERGLLRAGDEPFIPQRLTLENELRAALEKNELRPALPAEGRHAHRRIVGMEALVRWQHPRRA
jgi:GGDEF domain-containing protein